jgi:ribosomal-protein-alanine N-acetyltransferase
MSGVDLRRFPRIATDRLLLRECSDADAADILRFRGDREVQKYNTDPMRDEIEARGLIRTMSAWYVTRQAIQWGITLPNEDRVIGICGLHDWSRRHRRAYVGYDLAREFWSQGLGREAMRAVLRFAFDHLALNRLEAITIAENTRSIRLLEALGFQREGLRREYTIEADGAYHGSAIYGLLRHEYEEWAARLAASNRD